MQCGVSGASMRTLSPAGVQSVRRDGSIHYLINSLTRGLVDSLLHSLRHTYCTFTKLWHRVEDGE